MRFLKAVGSYCIIAVVLLYTTPLQQFLKVPAMLHHYKEHKERNTRISFLDFLFMHYIGDDGVADDESKDMQLPFKTSGNIASLETCGTSFIAVFLSPPRGEVSDRCYPLFNGWFFPDPHHNALLRPPQSIV